MQLNGFLLAVLDRCIRTAIQVVAGLLVAAHGTVDWRTIALATALAVVVSALQAVVDFPAIPGGLVVDVIGRALRTFAQAVAGSIGASVLITSVPWTQVLTAAALAAAASVVTSGITTNLGPAGTRGTPDLVTMGAVRYVGYTGDSRHLRTPTHTVSAFAAAAAAIGAIIGIGVLGVTAARDAPVRVLTAPAPTPKPAPPAPIASAPAPADRSPAFFMALNRNNIPTAADHTALLLIAQSVCTARSSATDAQQTDHIVASFPGRWTHAQAALIVDAAVDQYCS